jgi:F0F1-type ATP synthase assembly protein I
LILAAGLYLLVDPIVTIILNVHLLGKAVTFWEVATASLIVAFIMGLIIFGLAWFYYKPWLAIGFLALGLGCIAFSMWRTAHEGAKANNGENGFLAI